MSKLIASICLAAGIALGVNPYFGVRTLLEVADPMSMPLKYMTGTAGIRFLQYRRFALNAELTGTYRREDLLSQGFYFPNSDLWDVSLRLGAEFPMPTPDAYVVPGVMIAYASQSLPYEYGPGGAVYRPYGGVRPGLFASLGLMLFRIGDWGLDAQGGLDLLSVPTNWVTPIDPGFSFWGHYSIDLSGISLGLVVRKGTSR